MRALRQALKMTQTHPLDDLNTDLFYLLLSTFVRVCSRPPVRSDLASAARREPAVRERPELRGPSTGGPQQIQTYQLRPPAGHAQP